MLWLTLRGLLADKGGS